MLSSLKISFYSKQTKYLLIKENKTNNNKTRNLAKDEKLNYLSDYLLSITTTNFTLEIQPSLFEIRFKIKPKLKELPVKCV